MLINEVIYRFFHPKTINIHSQWGYPSCALSNLASYDFEMDGVPCKSMEGFLQSLKFKDLERQKDICQLAGIQAKRSGAEQDWHSSQTLHWQGKAYKRQSREYAELLEQDYNELFKNENFKKTLWASNNKKLRHTIGNPDPTKTILTEKEFCHSLNALRIKI